MIHDRGIPGRGRANIDHLAVGPGGVTVVDTKSTHGHVQLVTFGFFRRRELLLVNGRDRTRHLDAVQRQITTVVRGSRDRTSTPSTCAARSASPTCAADAALQPCA